VPDRQKKSSTNRPQSRPPAEAPLGDWQAEVEKLKSQRFETVEQAVLALAAALAARLAITSEEGLTEFLYDLLLTDPTIRDVLDRELVRR
jgi:hypothetical protein